MTPARVALAALQRCTCGHALLLQASRAAHPIEREWTRHVRPFGTFRCRAIAHRELAGSTAVSAMQAFYERPSGPWRVHALATAMGSLQNSGHRMAYADLASLSAVIRKRAKRRGRGRGDKHFGKGHKGQKSRSGTGKPALFFEGGQTPLWKTLPKRGFFNATRLVYDRITMLQLDVAIRLGKLDPSRVITMQHLYEAGMLEKKAYRRDGVVLTHDLPPEWLRRRLKRQLRRPLPRIFEIPIELQVAKCSSGARQAIELAGGKVTRVYYNKLGMRAVYLPQWFEKKGRNLPRQARLIPVRKAWRFDEIGAIPPPDVEALAEEARVAVTG